MDGSLFKTLNKYFRTIFWLSLAGFIGISNQALASAVNYIQTQADTDDALRTVSDVAVSMDGRFVYTASTGSSTVSVFERDLVTGTLTYQGKNAGVIAAFSVDVSSDNKNVYAASPTGNAIHTFSRNIETGALTKVGEVTNTDGTRGFVSVSVSPDNKHVYGVGGYPGANGLVVFNRDQSTGALTVLHDYKANVNDHALGQVFSATTSPIKNIVTSADGQFVYVTSTLDHAVTLFSRNVDTGALTQVAVYKDGVDGVDGIQAASSAKRSPDGKHLYVSGQGENSVAIFSINSISGELTYLAKMTNGVDGVETLTGVRSLAVSPDGRYVMASAITDHAITVFQRNASTGLLTLDSVVLNNIDGVTGLNAPSGMSTDPLNRHLYVAGQSAASIVVFSLPTPAVSLSTTTATAQVSGSAVILDSQLNLFDSDSPNLASATVAISGGFINTDALSVQTVAGISASYNSSTGVLALSGTAPLADYQAVLRTLAYQAGADPSLALGGTSSRTIGLQVTDDDGNNSAVVDISVTVEKTEIQLVTVTATVSGTGTITPASQTITQGMSATFALALVNPDDYVTIGGSCAAVRSGNDIVTAAVLSDCQLVVSVYPATEVEQPENTTVPANGAVSFRLKGGAGEKQVSAVDLLRGGKHSHLSDEAAQTLLTQKEDGSYVFSASRTGRYTVRFTDAVSGEPVELTFDVLPYLAFTASSQKVQKGQDATVGLWLSDEPVDYPVTATLGGEGITLQQTIITLKETDKLRQTQVVSTGSNINAATVQLVKSDAALPGTPAVQQLYLQDAPVTLPVGISAWQSGEKTRVVTQTGGLVTLEATGMADSYQWQVSDITLQADDHIATFNPQSLASGLYHITINAQTAAGNSGSYELALRIIDTCPVDDCSNLSQGIPASVNAYAETPNRLALCPVSNSDNRTHECEAESNTLLYIEVPNLYQLTLGSVSSEQSWQSGQFGLALTDDSLPADEGFVHQGVVVNFDIDGIAAPGDVVPVAIPLLAGTTIPAQAVWRKFIGGQWQDFVVNEANRIDSAARDVLGRCPGVSSDNWTTGLTQGHGCVRLLIEDGGPNDEDGLANGVIRDPGVLAVVQAAPEPEPEPSQQASVSSGGAAGAVMAGLLGTLVLWRRKAAVAALLLPLGVSANSFYSGADVLAVSNDTSNGKVTVALSQNGLSGSASVSDKSRTGFRVYGGYAVTDWLSAEVAWIDAGKIHTTFSDLPADATVGQLSAIRPASGEGAEVSVLLQPWTLADHFKPGLRIGLWRMKHTDHYQLGSQSVRHSDTDTVAVVELSGEYQLTSDWSVKAGISHYDVDNGAIRSAQLGVKYRF